MAGRSRAMMDGIGESSTPARRRYCAVRTLPPKPLPRGLHHDRSRAIVLLRNKWLNGTVLHYYFYTDRRKHGRRVRGKWRTWVGAEDQVQIVRNAFRSWKRLGIGLDFVEVERASEAEVRIGFEDGDEAWSYVGTEVLGIGPRSRTMNFGWALEGKYGRSTALHEIGHTLGLPHEHQNPFAGIVWDEDAVYEEFAGDPNFWPRETTYENIISKIDADEVQGSSWDPDSVMHYEFGPHLILKPKAYERGISPKGGLSARDRTWIQKFYPPTGAADLRVLEPGLSQYLDIDNGDQLDFSFEPAATRQYHIQTFGEADTHLALFEGVNGEQRYRTSDDDSGEARNAQLRVKLYRGRQYVVRVRLKFVEGDVPPSVMLW